MTIVLFFVTIFATKSFSMSNLKLYFYLGIIVLFMGLVTSICVLKDTLDSYKDCYYKELQNVEAYRADNSDLRESVRQYKMTVDDLYASKDSLDKKLVSTMNQLKIKDNKIKELQYQLTQTSRIDTIKVEDTIFVKDTYIDTTFGDEWYNMHLTLQYPSTIITTPTFNSEQYVYIYNKKEYKGGKSKYFFVNWFKKKYTVTEVKVEEKSPYVEILRQKFIEINK